MQCTCVIVLVAAFLYLDDVAAETTPPQPRSAAEIGKILAEVSGIDALEISPNGEWVAYSVVTRSISSNSKMTRWWLQKLPQRGETLPPAIPLPEKAESVRFRPGHDSLSLIMPRGGDEGRRKNIGVAITGHASKCDSNKNDTEFALYYIGTEKYEYVEACVAGDTQRATSIQITDEYQWSATGRFIAFVTSVPANDILDPRGGVPFEEWWQGRAGLRRSLYVLDVASGVATQVTPNDMNVATFGGFAWSPDEREFAVTIDPEGESQGTNTDLMIVDRASCKARSLVGRPGKDGNPTWSPDGRWIAFYTHEGLPSYWLGRPAVVSTDSGTISSFGNLESPRGWWIGQSWWAPDSRSFLYLTQREMTLQLVRADMTTLTLQAVPMAASDHTLPADRDHVISSDRRRMVVLRSSVTRPHELFVVDLDEQGSPEGEARQLTSLSTDFPLGKDIRAEIISWTSPDARHTIHGLLLTPSSAWMNGRIEGPLPTALFSYGGPGMVRRDFATDSFHGVMLALAERGFAVLSANTRGRGGYGDALEQGIADGKSMYGRPFEDAMAGVHRLIQDGIADPERLAVLGHSYGGSIAAYAITQTSRFKGAVLHEPGAADMLRYNGYPFEPGSWQSLIARDHGGVHNPTDPAERAVLLAESPGLHAEQVKTPTLMQFGANALAESAGRPLCNTWRFFRIPSACFVYDEGHVFDRPAAVADDLTRSVEWLDHWVRGVPYPESVRAAQYESWRSH